MTALPNPLLTPNWRDDMDNDESGHYRQFADEYQPRMCECSHSAGDHKWVRRGGLRPSIGGYCREPGCGCPRFTETEGIEK